MRSAVELAHPDVIIHAGAMSSAEAVRRQPALGWDVNVRATEVLSAWAGENQRRLLFTSTDLVFDGTKSWYRESDEAVPILEYGRTKLAAEALVLANCRGLVVRLSMLYGPTLTAEPAYFDQAIATLRRGRRRLSSKTSFALRSTMRRPRTFWSGWPSRMRRGSFISGGRKGSAASN